MSVTSETTNASSVQISEEMLDQYKNPDHEKIRRIKDDYYEMQENLNQMKDQAGDGGCSVEELTLHVQKANEVFEKVLRPEEARLDAKVLKQIGILGLANIAQCQSSFLTFRPAEFAKNLATFSENGIPLSCLFEEDSTSLQKLYEPMQAQYRTTYGLEPLHGALDWEPPVRSESNRATKSKDHSTKAKSIPLVEDSTTNEENQVEEVRRIHKVLVDTYPQYDGQPIPLLQFVIDPTCFASTVENLFHTSFLIRDDIVEIVFDEHKVACLKPVRKNERETRRNSGRLHKMQSIIDMNMDEWEEAIEAYGITRAIIPKVQRKINRKRTL